MLEGLPRREMEHWATIAWGIWHVCNKYCFDDTQARLEFILHGATTLLHEYQTLVANQQTR